MDPFAANQTPVADDNTIVDLYPQPLARAWQRVLIATPRPSFHHRQLLVAAETLADYVAAVAISAYEQYQAEGGAPDPTLNRSLRNLRRPTFGQWLGWAATALHAVPDDHALIPGLQAAYEAPDTGMGLLGYEGLRGLLVVYLGYTGDYGQREVATPRLLLELINQYQLRLANHPPAPDSGYDEMAAVTVLAPGLRAALGHLSLLAAYPLLGLVRTTAGPVEVLHLQGLGIGESSVEIDPDAPPPGTLLLANPDELPMLVLDPWLIYTQCPECGQVQVAAFRGRQGDHLQYYGFDCEHHWTQGPEVTLAEVQVAETGEPWLPDVGGLPSEAMTDLQARMFARFDAEADAMAAERQARRPVAPTAAENTGAARTRPDEVYRDLLEQRASGGLTLDQLQHLDEERAAAEDARDRARHPEEPR
jgi:hypothetical protein